MSTYYTESEMHKKYKKITPIQILTIPCFYINNSNLPHI